MRSPDTTSLAAEEGSPVGMARRYLLVLEAGRTRLVDLPERGTLVIGRDAEADVVIDDASVSRRHAEIVIEDADVTLRDLGSRHGLRLATSDQRLDAVPLRAGHAVRLGAVVLILGDTRDTVRQGGLVTHAEFEARLEVRLAAARAQAGQLAVGIVEARGHPAEAVTAALTRALGAGAVIGAYGTDHYQVLAAADGTAPGLAEDLRRGLTDAGVPVAVGIAVFPRDGTSAGLLVAAARAALRPPAAAATGDLIAESAAMRAVCELARRIAGGRIPILIQGETGSGKEMLADAIHRWSPRAAAPCVRLNCAAFPEALLEAELFGYEKGAFTGATAAKPGLFEAADGGTLFLDEIGDLPPAQQAKLLRALNDGTVRRVGSLRDHKVDVRVISATHRDLEDASTRGDFRADLFFRLSGATIEVPPLRDRPEDVLALARQFAAVDAVTLAARAEEALVAYAWPGNARELRNAIERAALLCDGGVVEVEHLPDRVRLVRRDAEPVAGEPRGYDAVKEEMRDVERTRIVEALDACGGNQTRAAELLGMPRRTLVAKLAALKIPRKR